MKKLLQQWLDPAKKEKLTKFLITASGIGLLAVILLSGVLTATNQPAFCLSCHKAMTPEYTTWAATSHSEISCTKCHINPGLLNTLIHKVKTIKEPILYFTGLWDKPIKPTETINSETCLECHSIKRNFTPSGDLIIPHDRHLNAGVLCVECHSGVAHAKIWKRGLTGEKAPVPPEKWTIKYAQEVVTTKYTNPDMDTCIACHTQRKKTLACEACHETIFTPDNHKNKDLWRAKHGPEAEQNLRSCKSCHNYGSSNKGIELNNPAIAYAWSNSFCFDCHSKMPPEHNNTTWRQKHRDAVQQKGSKNCEACHSPNDKYAKAAPAKTMCNACHWIPTRND